MEMAKYILSILRTQPMVVFSWGFHQPTAIENGLKFKVLGFKHTGWVVITYNQGADLFDITLSDSNMNPKYEIGGVYFDELVNTIDYYVEKVDDYNQKVIDEYSLL